MQKFIARCKKHPVIATFIALVATVTLIANFIDGLKKIGVIYWMKTGIAWLFENQKDSPSRFSNFIDISVDIPLWLMLLISLIFVALISFLTVKAIKKFSTKKGISIDGYNQDFFFLIYWQWDSSSDIMTGHCQLTARCPICNRQFDTEYMALEYRIMGHCRNCGYPSQIKHSLNITFWNAKKEIDRRKHSGEWESYKDRINEMNNAFPKKYKEAAESLAKKETPR